MPRLTNNPLSDPRNWAPETQLVHGGSKRSQFNETSEAIFLNTAGHICEGTGTNIFLVFGDKVITPPLSSGPLAGITRELIMEWCAVEQQDLTLDEALLADEAFLTSSMRDVQGVERWDDHTFSRANTITRAVAAAFAERSEADLDP